MVSSDYHSLCLLFTIKTLLEPTSFLDVNIPEHADPMFQVDDIKCEYHPSSGMAPEVHAFNDFKCRSTPLTSISPDKHPWAPFKSWLESRSPWQTFGHIEVSSSSNVCSVPGSLKGCTGQGNCWGEGGETKRVWPLSYHSKISSCKSIFD